VNDVNDACCETCAPNVADSPTPTQRSAAFRSAMMLRAALLALWLCTAAPYAGSSPGGHLTGKVVSCNA